MSAAGAVFLSYASEDKDAASRIADALLAAGVEVWFDKTELRGGDVWDQKIRRQIRDCSLFVAIVSPNTALRQEGYFRLEWDLADQRCHMIARDRPFILPVFIDRDPNTFSDVPDSFHRVQWTRLKSDQPATDLAKRVVELLGGDQEQRRRPAAVPSSPIGSENGWRGRWLILSALVLALGAALLFVWLHDARTAAPRSATAVGKQKSVAVLPFHDLSEKKDQTYLADGIAEDVLNALSRVGDLRVVGHASSFQFRERDQDLNTIAERLNVDYVVEGSVLKNQERVRVTAQLLDAHLGTRLWTESFDRGIGNVFELQDQIASGIARALQLAVRAEASGAASSTHNEEAYTAYLRGLWASDQAHQAALFEAQSHLERALSLDPQFLHAAEALAQVHLAQAFDESLEPKGAFERGRATAQQALKIDPNSAPALGVMALTDGLLNFEWAKAESGFQKALALNPRDGPTLRYAAIVAQTQGHHEDALHRIFQSIAVDPLDPWSISALGQILYAAGDFDKAIPAMHKGLEINSGFDGDHYYIGVMLLLRDQRAAAQAEIEAEPAENAHDNGLAMLYHALGRKSDSEAAMQRLTQSSAGRWPYGITQAHAFRHDRNETLTWAERSYDLRDPDFFITQGDPLLNFVRDDPRFQTILRKMNLAPKL